MHAYIIAFRCQGVKAQGDCVWHAVHLRLQSLWERHAKPCGHGIHTVAQLI
jgi:hypothetical protein